MMKPSKKDEDEILSSCRVNANTVLLFGSSSTISHHHRHSHPFAMTVTSTVRLIVNDVDSETELIRRP